FYPLLSVNCPFASNPTPSSITFSVKDKPLTELSTLSLHDALPISSGPGFHYCSVTNGYIIAAVRGESASLPSPPPLGQIAVGSDSLIMTLPNGDPMNLESAQCCFTEGFFESLMHRYCARPGGTGNG